MSTWMEKDITEDAIEAAVQAAPLFDDPQCTFSPTHIKAVEAVALRIVEADPNCPLDMLLGATAPYFGEIIRRTIGGEWVAIIDFKEPVLGYIRYGSYLIHPDAEIIWALQDGTQDHLVKYFQGVTDDVLSIKTLEAQKIKTKSPWPVFKHLFPDWYLDWICTYRDYEREKKDVNLPFLSVSISQLNQIHEKL